MSLLLCTFLPFLFSFPSLQIRLAAFPSRISKFLYSHQDWAAYILQESPFLKNIILPLFCSLSLAPTSVVLVMHFHSCCTNTWTLNYINQDTCLLKAYFNEGTQNIPQSLCCMQKDNNSCLDVLIQRFTSICSFCLWRIRQERNFVENKENENVLGK